MSKKCPKLVRRGCKHNFQTFFGQFLPIWSRLLFGDPVQCSPVTNVMFLWMTVSPDCGGKSGENSPQRIGPSGVAWCLFRAIKAFSGLMGTNQPDNHSHGRLWNWPIQFAAEWGGGSKNRAPPPPSLHPSVFFPSLWGGERSLKGPKMPPTVNVAQK